MFQLESRRNLGAFGHTMDERLSNIREVCYKIQESSNFSCSFQSKVSKYSQEINLNNFLREFNTGTIYCYIHKVKRKVREGFKAEKTL